MHSIFRDRERRRTERVMIRIPIRVLATAPGGMHVNESGEAVVVSRNGALLQTRSALPSGTIIEITNHFSKNAEKFRVIWASDKQSTGQYSLGVESVTPREGFWGVRFPPAVTTV